MDQANNISTQADSLLDLLIAQCADLEALLVLSRRETAAAEARNFEEMVQVVTARATLGERLEVYHRQIAEMRQRLGAAAEPALQSQTAARVTELITGILAQDEQTRPMLVVVRDEIGIERRNLDQMRRGLTAYLRDGRGPAVACDEHA
jgi:hypothetical protein